MNISKDKLRDMIYGIAVGDAFGVPYEFNNRQCTENMIGTSTLPKGTWSDDTAMTLCLLESILRLKTVDIDDIRNNYNKWYIYDEFTCGYTGCFDVGITIENALRKGCGVCDEDLQGNGSIMCIAPMILFNDRHKTERVCSILYNTNIQFRWCNTYIDILNKIINGKSKQDIWNDVGFSDDKIVSSGWVVDTLRCALYCFTQTNNFKDAIIKCINYGGDTDTCASICGAMCGLYYGYDNIPKDWINDLLSKTLIEKILDKYVF